MGYSRGIIEHGAQGIWGENTHNGDQYRKDHGRSLALTHHRHEKGGGRSVSLPFIGCFA